MEIRDPVLKRETPGERERERETERVTERQRERERECVILSVRRHLFKENDRWP